MASFEPVGLVKRSCASHRGIIVTKHPIATAVGRDVLAGGGNAYDAAIAASFVLAVVEPYMSGIGGVGLALVGDGDGLVVLDGGPVAPRSLDVTRFRPLGDQSDADLFGWPRVLDDANILGPTSVCIPTMVALMAALHGQGASLPWSEILAPAVGLARGFPVDWLLTLSITQDQRDLRAFPSTAGVFFPQDSVPAYNMDGPTDNILVQPALAETLEILAGEGWRALYEGDLAVRIVNALQADGGFLSADDLASYRIRLSHPLRVDLLGTDLWVTDGLNGGATVAEMLYLHDELAPPDAGWGEAPDLAAWVRAGAQAFHDRFAQMGHAGDHPSLGTRDQARRSLAQAEPTIPSGGPDGSTTYLAVTDAEGRIVSMNLTLLSRWGSRYVVPDLGVLMNNGIMWFDPIPGRPNSLAPGARPLANMVPVIAIRGGQPVLAVGASGGRRIISALPQILTNVFRHGMDIQQAIAAPRLEFSTDLMLADSRFPDGTIRQVEQLTGRPFARYLPRLASSGYASPLGLLRWGDGTWTAGLEPTSMATSGCL